MREEALEYNILGSRVRFTPDHTSSEQARDIVKVVQTEVDKIRLKRPELSERDIAVLVALKFAGEKAEMQRRVHSKVEQLESTINSALEFVDRVEPLL